MGHGFYTVIGFGYILDFFKALEIILNKNIDRTLDNFYEYQ
jgi:hypothetical protein